MLNRKEITMMMIDDNEIDQILSKRIIRKSGLVDNLLCHLYAEDALRYLQEKQTPAPDIILLDINMPRMNGFEFLEAASQLPLEAQKPVIIMLTTSLDPREEACASAFDLVKGHISKPLSLDIVQTVISIGTNPTPD